MRELDVLELFENTIKKTNTYINDNIYINISKTETTI